MRVLDNKKGESMNFLKLIWQDILHGENIDLYLTVVAALILSLGNLLGVVPGSFLLPVTMAILALLAITNLVNRRKLDEVLNRQEAKELFLDDYPNTVTQDIENAKELWLSGYTLTRTFLNMGNMLEEKLRRNEKVKVLLLDPDSDGIKYANNGLYFSMTIEQFRSRILTSLGTLSQLYRKYPKYLEIRLTSHPLPFGTYSMNINMPSGIMYIEIYKYKSKTIEPHFVLRKRDGKWFELYHDQLLAFWQEATPYKS